MLARGNGRSPAWDAVKVAVVVGLALLAFGIYKVMAAALYDGPTSVPGCSWPLRVRGTASTEQAGLIRCYLRALATRSYPGPRAVVDNNPPVRLTRAQFAHAADARAGEATATFVQNQVDDAYVTVAIVFADGARDSVPMQLANPASGHSWRLQIGSASPDPNAPAPARP